jgi:hypothetical protein
MSAPLFPPTPALASLVRDLNSASSLPPLLAKLLSLIGVRAGGDRFFTDPEEAQLSTVLGFSREGDDALLAPESGGEPALARVRRVVEGAAYLFETAAFANLKTAAFGEALLAAGLNEATAVAFATAWTAGSAAAIGRLRSRPFGAPLILSASSFRVALGIGSSAETDVRETSAVLDLALSRSADVSTKVDDVVSVEFNRAQLLGFLEKLDAIQAQVDSLS